MRTIYTMKSFRYDFIRPERTFDSLEKLKQQIEADIETCRRIVGNNK